MRAVLDEIQVVISAGGTGGHLFPARALGEELARRGVQVELMTDHRAQSLGDGFPARHIHLIVSATPVGRSVLRLVGACLTLVRGIAMSIGLLKSIAPRVVIGFGGYPTVPPLIAARLLGQTTVIHEQNAVMGRANRLIARFSDAVALSTPYPKNAVEKILKKSVVSGNPVRDTVIAASKTVYQPPDRCGPFRFLVFGGSQGAHVFAQLVPEALGRLEKDLRSRLLLVQQCREDDVDAVRNIYSNLGIDAQVSAFFPDLPQRMADAHLILARSGASTVSELAAIGRPAIMVPLPNAIDNDQRENARRLAETGGGWMIEQDKLDAEMLADCLTNFSKRPEILIQAAREARLQGKLDAVNTLANLVIHLASGQTVTTFKE